MLTAGATELRVIHSASPGDHPSSESFWQHMSVQAPTPEDIVLGTISPKKPPICLNSAEQALHGLVWGSTGTGKSKLLESIFLQHLNKGHGVCLIDPHSDLALSCISYLVTSGYFRRADAFDQLVYLDFGQGSHVPFNVLSTHRRLDPHATALNTLEALTRTWTDLKNAPLFRHSLSILGDRPDRK